MTGLYLNFGHALRMTGRLEEAVSAYKKSLQRAPENVLAHVALTGTYSLMGREGDARAEAAEVLRINPKFSVDHYAKIAAFKNQVRKDEFINALRNAGLK
jgi:adenylate cyclase